MVGVDVSNLKCMGVQHLLLEKGFHLSGLQGTVLLKVINWNLQGYKKVQYMCSVILFPGQV